jgi:nitroreductase
MNETIKKQLSRRSIRAFTGEAVPGEMIDTLFAVANRTATSAGLQQFSIVRMTDTEAKRRVSRLCEQEYIERLPEIFIFIADCYRNFRIARAQGLDGEGVRGMNSFLQAFTDTCLAAQNVATAIESAGLGSVFFSLGNLREWVDLLALPEFTFPVLGLGFGYPAQDPPRKPRMDVTLKVFENRYAVLDDYPGHIAAYDEAMQKHYDAHEKGKSSASFSHLVGKKTRFVREKHERILDAMQRQGFDLQRNR